VGFIATPARRMVMADQSGMFGWHTLDQVAGTLPFALAAWYFVGNSPADGATP
jgi:hypothetical protein